MRLSLCTTITLSVWVGSLAFTPSHAFATGLVKTGTTATSTLSAVPQTSTSSAVVAQTPEQPAPAAPKPAEVKPAAAPVPEAPLSVAAAPAERSARKIKLPAERQPLLSYTFGESKMRVEAPLSAVGRFEAVQGFLVDRDGSELETSALNTQLRVGLRFNSGRLFSFGQLAAEYEHDLVTGPLTGRNELGGAFLPEAFESEQQLRKAMGRFSFGRYVHAIGGFTTSHFGLGLVANDGAHGWTPGSAVFNDPRGGDRVIRASLATGPHTSRLIFAAVNVDWVQSDDVVIEGDEAMQLSAAVIYGRGKPNHMGVYVAHRMLDAENGGRLEATALDVSGQYISQLSDETQLKLEGELVAIFGNTTAAGPAEFLNQDIQQIGFAGRATYSDRFWGSVLDVFYGTGDANLNDSVQSGFKADPNYAMGMILFRHLLAAQTGRAAATAADPLLVGQAPRGIERFASRGAATAALALFPRAYVRPLEGLEVYGGPLFAFATNNMMDPFNSHIAGGSPRNALNGNPGSYLGTEIDLGARYQLDVAGTLLNAGIEGGVLLPGDAFNQATGNPLDSILSGRVILSYQL